MHSEGSSEWILRIRSVQLRDEGKYECQITTKPIKTYSIFLKVVGKRPNFTVENSSYSAIAMVFREKYPIDKFLQRIFAGH